MADHLADQIDIGADPDALLQQAELIERDDLYTCAYASYKE
jgi:hypothetical protein